MNTASTAAQTRPTLLYALALLALASSLSWLATSWQWPWRDLFRDPDSLPLAQAAVQTAVLPQIAAAFLAGGLLALASSALQQIVRNPLASDSTLAVGSGAQLALMTATLFIPAVGGLGSFAVAFLGAAVAVALVLGIAHGSGMHPQTIILGGLIINLLFGAIAAVITLYYHDLFIGIMVWGAGSLLQDGWTTTRSLALATLAAGAVLALLYRPLTLLALDDAQARRLGAPVTLLRHTVLALAAACTALVVSSIGIISFIGLAGAAIANRMRLRHLHSRLAAAFLAGGFLLVGTDNLLNHIGRHYDTILPAGALSGILGVPLLLCIILKQRKSRVEPAWHDSEALHRLHGWRLPLGGLCLLAVLLILALGYTNTPHGWHWQWPADIILAHRLPRSLSAIATGALLAVAGALLQTLTRNLMAGPEVLGISSGASLAVLTAYYLAPTLGSGALVLAGSGGSIAVLLLILWLARYLQPSTLLLTGIAISALMNGVMALAQQSGNPQLTGILSWLSGSTYYARAHTVWLLAGSALLLCAAAQLSVRPLQILSLGDTIAGSLGLRVRAGQCAILLIVALMTTLATLAVGPLSFIGLMTPHLARRLGAITADKLIPVSALTGAILLLIADWLGRYLHYPYEIGAGTIAGILGGGYFLFLLRENRS